ncbi:MAG TPA: trehalose-phosphatase [Gammaproteobacteria bacterium]|nr:trehalose-phosphatase [Gammaproteobacteria bacterium]
MSQPRPSSLSRDQFDAVIFDLDGVVTDTAALHAAAWKQTFDAFLCARDGEAFRPFDLNTDYRNYVDGRPRLDGVRSFLAARGLTLPEGEAGDEPESETVHGLGKRKQVLFRQLLSERGVYVFGNSVRFIRLLRRLGYRTAMVTSSRNAELILRTAGLERLFDARLDGVLAAELGLAGKPAPDTFLHGARMLGVAPARSAVVEDALAGIQAAQAGSFGLVIELRRDADGSAGYSHGADLVVPDLVELTVAEVAGTSQAATLPSVFTAFAELSARLRSEPPLLLLDYDGTLAAIAPRPELAILTPQMRATLVQLAERCPLAVVSGRDLSVLQQLVGLPGLVYAGDHGFSLLDRSGRQQTLPELADFLPLIAQTEARLRELLGPIPGILIERKRYSVAVHYRLVADSDLEQVQALLAEIASGTARLKSLPGKKVLEFLPALDWHKGRAVEWLLQQLDPQAERYPIYLGDDLTDEDAFRPLRGIGLGILVRDSDRPTAARYVLDGQAEVQVFLDRLLETIR